MIVAAYACFTFSTRSIVCLFRKCQRKLRRVNHPGNRPGRIVNFVANVWTERGNLFSLVDLGQVSYSFYSCFSKPFLVPLRRNYSFRNHGHICARQFFREIYSTLLDVEAHWLIHIFNINFQFENPSPHSIYSLESNSIRFNTKGVRSRGKREEKLYRGMCRWQAIHFTIFHLPLGR